MANWRQLANWGVLRVPVPSHLWQSDRLSQAFGILMYHRVAHETPGVEPPTWNVTPERFRQQLVGLLDRGYQAWPLRKALDYHRHGRAIPRRTFVVTFDDGYANNYLHAWPILRELQVPATIFLATAYLDSTEPFPFDDWSAAGSAASDAWRPLRTDEATELLDGGLVELGAHTHTHVDLSQQPETMWQEMLASRDVLVRRFGYSDVTFAYPFGIRPDGFAERFHQQLSGEGILCTLMTAEELVTPDAPPTAWGRFTAGSLDSPLTLAAKLSGHYSAYRNAWRRVRACCRQGQIRLSSRVNTSTKRKRVNWSSSQSFQK